MRDVSIDEEKYTEFVEDYKNTFLKKFTMNFLKDTNLKSKTY